jgi:hypothetical protein
MKVGNFASLTDMVKAPSFGRADIGTFKETATCIVDQAEQQVFDRTFEAGTALTDVRDLQSALRAAFPVDYNGAQLYDKAKLPLKASSVLPTLNAAIPLYMSLTMPSPVTAAAGAAAPPPSIVVLGAPTANGAFVENSPRERALQQLEAVRNGIADIPS